MYIHCFFFNFVFIITIFVVPTLDLDMTTLYELTQKFLQLTPEAEPMFSARMLLYFVHIE